MIDALEKEGLAAWPALKLSRALLERHAARLKPSSTPHLADFYLAAAAIEQLPSAQRAVDALLSSTVERCARRLGGVDAYVPEALQALRVRLFTDRNGLGSALLGFDGSGALGAWLRTGAVRELMRQKGLQHPDTALDTSALERLPAEERDPELSILRASFRPHFKVAFRAALESLSPRERTLLSLIYFEGVSLVELSRMYRQHRVTLARHVASARTGLLLETRRRLSALSGVPEGELDSLLAVVQTGLSGNIKDLLR